MGRKLSDHDMALFTRAFDVACVEATLTGAAGRGVIHRLVLERYRSEAGEEEIKSLVKKIIAQRRGLLLLR